MTIRVPDGGINDDNSKLDDSVQVPENLKEIDGKFGPHVDVTLKRKNLLLRLFAYAKKQSGWKNLFLAWAAILFIWSLQEWGGNPIFVITAITLWIVISLRFVGLEIRIREIYFDAYIETDSPFQKIKTFTIALQCLCFLLGFLITIGTMVFINNAGNYLWVILVDGIIFLFFFKRFSYPLKGHLKDNVGAVFGEILVNSANVFILFAIFFVLEVVFASQPLNFQSGLDPRIPLEVKDSVQHDSHYFEMILRVKECLSITLDNIAHSVNPAALKYYRAFSLLTMSFWPFLGVTIIYRLFLSGRGIALFRWAKMKINSKTEVKS